MRGETVPAAGGTRCKFARRRQKSGNRFFFAHRTFDLGSQPLDRSFNLQQCFPVTDPARVLSVDCGDRLFPSPFSEVKSHDLFQQGTFPMDSREYQTFLRLFLCSLRKEGVLSVETVVSIQLDPDACAMLDRLLARSREFCTLVLIFPAT